MVSSFSGRPKNLKITSRGLKLFHGIRKSEKSPPKITELKNALVACSRRRRNGSLQHNNMIGVDEYPLVALIDKRANAVSYHYSMQGPTEAFIPTKYVVGGRVVGGTMRRKNGIRTLPRPAARAESPALPPHPPPQLEDEDLPPAKRARLQARTSISATADGVTTDSADDTPTDPVTPAASLPSAATSRAPYYYWKAEEDAQLTEAVEKHSNHWVAVAKLVPDRTSVQCRQRWVDTLDPASGKKAGPWTPEEDAELTKAVKKYGKHWVAVAAMAPDRTDQQCRQRWTFTLDPAGENKGKPRRGWTAEEAAKLTKAVEKHGKDWAAVALLVPGRTSVQCSRRWFNTLKRA
jgi:hypothetical protein